MVRCILSAVCCLLLAVCCPQLDAQDTHRVANPLYADLCKEGLLVQSKKRLSLTTPLELDGLDAKAQTAAIQKLAGADYPLDELLRPSVVAPLIFKFRDLPGPTPDLPVHAVDLYFVAHGSFEKLTAKNLESLVYSNRKDTKVSRLSDKDLKARGLTATRKEKFEESYFYTELSLIERVQLQGTQHAMFSQSVDSLVLASRLDTRFADDGQYANRWRSMMIEDSGKTTLGPLERYEGAALTIRASRLKEPTGAIFIEYHQVFVEPKAWFQGANPLRSKLPILLQNEVRAFRRELSKG